ncbi:MAG: hypothetical protein ACXWQO_07505 [Bdellovibrionota bacterium]
MKLLNSVLALALTLSFTACSGGPKAKYKEEENTPKFSTGRSFTETPETILRAARAVLDEMNRASEPAVTGSLKGNEESVRTGWVYSQSKDKYVEFQFNGSPKRKILQVRRKYTYTAVPSLAGSQVTYGIEEEIQKVDLKSGEPTGWEKVEPAQAAYDDMAKRLRQKIQEQ